MPLVNFEINLLVAWSESYVISGLAGATKFTIAETILYVPVVTL